MENNPYDVTFMPMIKSHVPVDLSTLRPKNDNNYFGYSLKKGEYDINYVINLLKIIMTKCEGMKHNPKDLQFTLWTSTQKLLAMLEVERDQQ